jgi:putative FmdB family regulatory protein
MPFYEYTCPKCGTRFELMRAMSQRDEPAACPECGAKKAKRELASFATSVRGGSGGGGACRNTGSGFS